MKTLKVWTKPAIDVHSINLAQANGSLAGDNGTHKRRS
jgi:hypothetical protein